MTDPLLKVTGAFEVMASAPGNASVTAPQLFSFTQSSAVRLVDHYTGSVAINRLKAHVPGGWQGQMYTDLYFQGRGTSLPVPGGGDGIDYARGSMALVALALAANDSRDAVSEQYL